MDGRITLLAGTTFAEFVEEHRRPLIRVVASVCGDLVAATTAVDDALTRAERRWEQIDDDPAPWILRRALRNCPPVEQIDVPDGFEPLPLAERLDAVLFNHLAWRPSRRQAAGALAAPHAERYAESIDRHIAGLAAIPPRPTRSPRAGRRIAAISVAIATAVAALFVAGSIGGPEPLATVPTLPELESVEPVEQVRLSRLLAAPQLTWGTPLGVRANQFVQVGSTTVGYIQTSEGVRAWSTTDGWAWIDHGIVIVDDLPLLQVTEGGPGVLAVTGAAVPGSSGTRLYSSADGLLFEERASEIVAEATWISIVGASSDVTVISVVKDETHEWDAEVLRRLGATDRAVAAQYGSWTQGSDFVVLGPFYGVAKRISLRDLGLDPADAPRPPGYSESVWYSADLAEWHQIDDPLDVIGYLGVGVAGTALPGGEVAIPARGSSTRYVVAGTDGTSALSSNRLVEPLRPFHGGVVGVSDAYPFAQIVRSSDLVEWTEISPDLAGSVDGSYNDVRLASGDAGLAAAYTRFDWDRSTLAARVEIVVDDLTLQTNTGGMKVFRDGEELANYISLQDERLIKHDLARRTVTFLEHDTLEPLVTIPFEIAEQLVAPSALDVSEHIELLYTRDGVEWSIEMPPFYAGGPIRMTDLHVGNGIVIIAVEATTVDTGATQILVGRIRGDQPTVPAR